MIEFRNVFFSYQEEKNNFIDSVDLRIAEGECVLLCGKSGCGKTTITRLLNGMIPNFYDGKQGGEVRIHGKNISQLPMYEISKIVGTVFQNPRTQFYTVNTTTEIAFGCENLGMDPETIADRVRQTAMELQIEHLLDRNIFMLSSGEKQIIAFASIYAMQPQIYVLDEPSANLDSAAIMKLREMLALLKQQGKTIVIAEHRTFYLKDLVDRAIYLEDGKITGEYTMEQLENLSFADKMRTGLRTINHIDYPLQEHSYQDSDLDLSIHNVSFSYGKLPVLKIPKLQMSSGKITAIIGSNGAGKSTFVSCLCGLQKKVKGSISQCNIHYSQRSRLLHSYLVMQEVNHQLFSDSVYDEIILGTRSPSPAHVKTIMDDLDISTLSDRHPMTLSGGQKQRVMIASAMFCGKQIIFFDEPTSGLDFYHMMQTCSLIRKLQAENKFVFIITHDYEFIASVCTDVIQIEQGQVLAHYELDTAGFGKLKKYFNDTFF